MLTSHTILAIAIVPMVIISLTRALKGRFADHKRIARWTLPLWAYVSVTGVLVYFWLYQVYAAPQPGRPPLLSRNKKEARTPPALPPAGSLDSQTPKTAATQ